ncbi:MAG: hypothetical protein QGG54_03475 [Gammaproteobacteria bacterium]|jgi:hypothetical protein|nr:hypothetical protein [Chromatiales bacterium]MDP6414078.1 hypothetical protein [Gammaproteobacteria bacterium]MDP6673593.1 hypothetical protein [Gammaproteobacteria bacterium]
MIIQPANNSPDLTTLERSVLEMAFLATGTDPGFRDQINVAKVAMRTPSGVGFVTKLSIAVKHRVVDTSCDDAMLVVMGEHPALPSGADFILHIKSGRINCIEAFCPEGAWPADEELFDIRPGSAHAKP